jgi:hypothetical protein
MFHPPVAAVLCISVHFKPINRHQRTQITCGMSPSAAARRTWTHFHTFPVSLVEDRTCRPQITSAGRVMRPKQENDPVHSILMLFVPFCSLYTKHFRVVVVIIIIIIIMMLLLILFLHSASYPFTPHSSYLHAFYSFNRFLCIFFLRYYFNVFFHFPQFQVLLCTQTLTSVQFHIAITSKLIQSINQSVSH